MHTTKVKGWYVDTKNKSGIRKTSTSQNKDIKIPWVNEWINESMNQRINESTNQRINESTNQWINEISSPMTGFFACVQQYLILIELF